MVCVTFVYAWRKRRLATRNSYKPENIGEVFENRGYQSELVHIKTMDDEEYPGGNKHIRFSATKADPNHYEFE